MRSMRNGSVAAAIVVTFLLICFGAFVGAQQKPAPPAQKPAEKASQPQGKIVERKAAEVPKFPKPVDKPHHPQPPAHPGHSWHWHHWHGWVAFPVAVAPRVQILEPTYQLPPRLFWYEVQAVGAVPAHMCPHCGQPVIVTLSR